MASNHSHIDQLSAAKAFTVIDNSIKSLGTIDMEMENTAIAEMTGGRVARLEKVYGAVKPLLVVLSTLALIPASWRAGLLLFISSLDAVIAVAPQLGEDVPIRIDDPKPEPVFKAGKDL